MKRSWAWRNHALALAVTVALVAVARGQGDGEGEKKDPPAAPQRIEYVRVPLYSVVQNEDKEAKLERGLYIGFPRSNSQTFRMPVEIPVNSTILEVGLVGQTSNQMAVRVERIDWTPVYAFGETTPRENGAWTVMSIVKAQAGGSPLRQVGKPTPDDPKFPVTKRDHEEQEFIVEVSLARDPNMPGSQRNAYVGNALDKVTALWLKIAR